MIITLITHNCGELLLIMALPSFGRNKDYLTSIHLRMIIFFFRCFSNAPVLMICTTHIKKGKGYNFGFILEGNQAFCLN